MLARFGLGFKIPTKPLIIQILVAILLLGYLGIPNVKAPIVEGSEILPVDGFVSELDEWQEVGAYPYLDVDDNETAYIWNDHSHDDQKYFTVHNIENVTKIDSVFLYVKYWDEIGNQYLRMQLWTEGGGGVYDWSQIWNVNIPASVWTLKSKDMTYCVNTTTQVNNFRVWFDSSDSSMTRNVTYAYLNVTGLIRTPLISYIDVYFGLGLFLGGIIMMVFAPSWFAWKVKKSGVTPETVERFGYAMLLFLIGLGLFINYIYGV